MKTLLFTTGFLSILHIKGTIKNFHLEPPSHLVVVDEKKDTLDLSRAKQNHSRWLRDQTRLLIDVIRLYFVSGTVVFVFTKGNRAPGNV